MEGNRDHRGRRVAATSEADGFAARLRGFGPVGFITLVAIVLVPMVTVGGVAVPLGALLVLLWARWSRTPVRGAGGADRGPS